MSSVERSDLRNAPGGQLYKITQRQNERLGVSSVFHTWYLSHRIHDDRETSCDDLVLAMGCDRLQYAQSLLRVAELRLASQSHQNHIALAADGQRPSKLRNRIARLLGDGESDSMCVSSVWLVVPVRSDMKSLAGTELMLLGG